MDGSLVALLWCVGRITLQGTFFVWSLPSFRWCFFSLLSKTVYPFWPPWSGVLCKFWILHTSVWVSLYVSPPYTKHSEEDSPWHRLLVLLLGNRAILNKVCLPDAPQVCGRDAKTSVEISYSHKSPTCFHWEKVLKILQLSVFWQQSECFRAEVRMPRRGRFGEFPCRNISYVRKSDNRLECKVFTARPPPKKNDFSTTEPPGTTAQGGLGASHP